MSLLSLVPELVDEILYAILLEDSSQTAAITLFSLSLSSRTLRIRIEPYLYATASILSPVPSLPLTATAILSSTRLLQLHLPPSFTSAWLRHTPAFLELIPHCSAITNLKIVADTRYTLSGIIQRRRNPATRTPDYTRGLRYLTGIDLFPVLSYRGPATVVLQEHARDWLDCKFIQSRYEVVASGSEVAQRQGQGQEEYEALLINQLSPIMETVTLLDLQVPPAQSPRTPGAGAWTRLLDLGIGKALTILRLTLPDDTSNGDICKAVDSLARQLEHLRVHGGCVCQEMFVVGDWRWANLRSLVVKCPAFCVGGDREVFFPRMGKVVESAGGGLRNATVAVGGLEWDLDIDYYENRRAWCAVEMKQ